MPQNPLIEAFRQTLTNMGQNERNLGQGVPPPQPSYIRPEVDLDPIHIIKSWLGGQGGQGGQQPQAQAPAPMPTPPMNIASPMENVGMAGQQAQPQGNGINWQMLMDIGIPALSALVGTVAPGTLPAAAGLSKGYTDTREKQRQAELDKEKFYDFNPDTGEVKKVAELPKGSKIIDKSSAGLTAAERNYKRKQIKDFSENYANNNFNLRLIEEAAPLVDNLPTGLGGKIKMWELKNFNPDSPVLADWQKIKSILTDTTLLYSMNTKGAISDREMEEFKQAAANDELISKPRILASFEKYKRLIESENEGKIDAFYQSFGEDPREGMYAGGVNSDFSTLSDDELDARIQELEGKQ